MNALFNQVINCKFIKNIKLNKMEEQVNKLIEKIENDSVQHYDFNEVLDMLKDLLVSNQEFYCAGYSIHNCEFQCRVCNGLRQI